VKDDQMKKAEENLCWQKRELCGTKKEISVAGTKRWW
jgi:hypothetical protein